jgi:hypothetical protein
MAGSGGEPGGLGRKEYATDSGGLQIPTADAGFVN